MLNNTLLFYIIFIKKKNLIAIPLILINFPKYITKIIIIG